MKNLFVKAMISVAALLVGFGAMVLPFHLFNNLTPMQMRILFFAEIIVYFLIASAFFLIKEAKEERKARNLEFEERHARRVAKRRNELKGIRVDNYDLAA